jgi:ABC-type Mn2+/Zn2+ transport system permease subunit/Mn-dependent DtxR family transcriptional regulator
MDIFAQLTFEPELWTFVFKELPEGLWTSVLVGITCGVLGSFVVLRQMALIGDALSHAILPGVVIAFLLTNNTGIWGLLLGALLAGLLTAVLINLVSHNSRTKEDSAIGIVFTALFALGLILISNLPRGTHFDLKCFVFGIPDAVSEQEMILMAAIAAIVIGTIYLLYHPLKLVSFDPVVATSMGIPVLFFHYLLMGMISATVVAGLKTTGVILVVAMVITPASAAYQLTNRFSHMLILAGFFGGLSAFLGMILAFVINAPSGPSMVLVATFIFAISMLFSPTHGYVFEKLRKLRLKRHIDGEDILKAIYKLEQHQETATKERIGGLASLPLERLPKLFHSLRKEQLLNFSEVSATLTENGRKRAIELVRSHRLWESYLAQHANIPTGDLHSHAEQLEHAHELADEIDKTLGHPKHDPHGSEIPGK